MIWISYVGETKNPSGLKTSRFGYGFGFRGKTCVKLFTFNEKKLYFHFYHVFLPHPTNTHRDTPLPQRFGF